MTRQARHHGGLFRIQLTQMPHPADEKAQQWAANDRHPLLIQAAAKAKQNRSSTADRQPVSIATVKVGSDSF
jgi:hypothetical protein